MALNDSGVALLPIDEDRVFAIFHCPPQPGLVIAVTMPPELVRDDMALRALLAANLRIDQTAGGVFAAPPGMDAPMLMRLVPASVLSTDGLSAEVEALVDLVEDWIDALVDMLPDEALPFEPHDVHSQA